MTTEHARQIADEISSNIFGAGASETQRLGALAVSTIGQLADQLDARDRVSPTPPDPPADDEPASKSQSKRLAHAKDQKTKGRRKK